EGETLRVIRNQSVLLPAKEAGLLSVFALGGNARGVTIRGLYYEAEGVDLTPSFPLGVSNHFCGREAFVEVKEGNLLICEETTAG
ncbi:MAG: thiamine diphosphokinase, partial [Clostridia bacterium]|nr:thiamine diphosphokinase [Clostridia bacterium]